MFLGGIEFKTWGIKKTTESSPTYNDLIQTNTKDCESLSIASLSFHDKKGNKCQREKMPYPPFLNDNHTQR